MQYCYVYFALLEVIVHLDLAKLLFSVNRNKTNENIQQYIIIKLFSATVNSHFHRTAFDHIT